MGGAAVALRSAEEAIYWNPAMLSHLDGNRLGVSYVNLVPGAAAYHSHLAYARILKQTSDTDIGKRFATHAAGFLFTNLRLELCDESVYSEYTFRFAYAYAPDYFLSFGVGANVLVSTSDLQSFDGKGTSVDAALRVELLENCTFGFIARNAASNLSYGGDENLGLPRSYTFGAAVDIVPCALVEADIVIAHGGLSRLILAAEGTLFSNALALRGGISALRSGESRTIPHMGLGLRIHRFSLNYNANLDMEKAFEDTHRFSLSVAL